MRWGIISGAAVTAAAVAAGAALSTHTETTASRPSAPPLVLQRTLRLQWTKTPQTTAYRLWLDGRPVKTVAAAKLGVSQRSTLKIVCPGRHRVNVQARNGQVLGGMRTAKTVVC